MTLPAFNDNVPLIIKLVAVFHVFEINTNPQEYIGTSAPEAVMYVMDNCIYPTAFCRL